MTHYFRTPAYSRLLLLPLVHFTLLSLPAMADPSVFWASDPVSPNETVLLTGDELDKISHVTLTHLTDSADKPMSGSAHATAVDLIQQNSQSLKFLVPQRFPQGVYRYNLITKDRSISGTLNTPTVYWVQGDEGPSATPGGWLRAFGRNIGRSKASTLILTPIESASAASITLQAQTWSLWDASFSVPSNTPLGRYRLTIWNGQGDSTTRRDAGTFDIRVQKTQPSNTVDVTDFGAKGNGQQDDTSSVKAALTALENKGGGTLFFPRGRYMFSEELQIPPHVTLRGQARELVSLNWSELQTPPPALISGFSDFLIENLTIYASNYAAVISGGFVNTSQATNTAPGNISIKNVLVRASAYRGHITPEQALKIFTAGRTPRTLNGPVTIQLTGRNLSVTDSDIYGSGSAFLLLHPQGAYLARNSFTNGREGWYSITAADGVIFEDNKINGADLQSTGGGINTLSTTAVFSQNVFFSRNTLSSMYGADREAVTSDGPGGFYLGQVEALESDRISLLDVGAIKDSSRPWPGTGLFVVAGRGAGEYATVKHLEGPNTVVLSTSLAVRPDQTSIVTIVPMQRNYLFIDNDFSDAGVAIQFYGTSLDNVVAGNRSTRTGGFLTYGRYYRHFQPSWYVQLLGNRIIEGNIYRSGTNNSIFVGTASIGAYGVQTNAMGPPLTRGLVLRRNTLDNNAKIVVSGGSFAAHPGLVDGVVDHNRISNAGSAIMVDVGAKNVLLGNNSFDSVTDRSVLNKPSNLR